MVVLVPSLVPFVLPALPLVLHHNLLLELLLRSQQGMLLPRPPDWDLIVEHNHPILDGLLKELGERPRRVRASRTVVQIPKQQGRAWADGVVGHQSAERRQEVELLP